MLIMLSFAVRSLIKFCRIFVNLEDGTSSSYTGKLFSCMFSLVSSLFLSFLICNVQSSNWKWFSLGILHIHLLVMLIWCLEEPRKSNTRQVMSPFFHGYIYFCFIHLLIIAKMHPFSFKRFMSSIHHNVKVCNCMPDVGRLSILYWPFYYMFQIISCFGSCSREMKYSILIQLGKNVNYKYLSWYRKSTICVICFFSRWSCSYLNCSHMNLYWWTIKYEA